MNNILAMIVSAITLMICTNSQGAAWFRNADMRTGYQQLYNNPTVFFNSSNTPISYFIQFSSGISLTRSAGLGIVGFNTLITNDYSLNSTIQNFTTTSLRITGKVYGDTLLTFFSVNWIAIGNVVDCVQVLQNCHLCTKLNSGRGYRSENITGATYFIGYVQLYVNVYLSGFQLHNSDGLTNYLNATASIPGGTNVINYQFETNENNTVNQICYTTIIFNQIITKDQYYDWGKAGNVLLSQTVKPESQLVFPSVPFVIDYRDRDKMFYGMGSFSLSRATRRLFYLFTQNYGNLDTGYTANSGTYHVRIDFFWLAKRHCNRTDGQQIYWDMGDYQCKQNCPNNTNPVRYQTTPGFFCTGCHYTCLQCDASHGTNCTGCSATFFRTLKNLGGGQDSCPCDPTYIDIGVSLCYPCQAFIPGCKTCTSISLCQTCLPGFQIQPTGICQCTLGFLVSGICTTITGCIAAVQYAGTTYCTSCNDTLFYQVNSNYTCSCMIGFFQGPNNICLSTCGDARQVSGELCDDGNLNNGDGCSSLCIVENKWICEGGSSTSPSICFINDNITMKIRYVRRVTDSNRMQVGVKFQPFYDQLTQTNFQKYITHNVPCTDFNATFVNGTLILQFDYNRTIEGQFFDLNLLLDPSIFYNSKLSLQIPASGMNGKLTYDYANNVNQPMQIIVIVLDVIAIIVMFLSCLSERMIGIQMIQTIQTVLYAQAVMKTTPSSLTPLQKLRYASGYNQIQGIDYGRTYTFAFSLSSLGLQKQFMLSYNLMYLILILIILVCLGLKLKQYYHQNKIGKSLNEQDEDKNLQKLALTTKVYHIAFERVFFLIGFMCMFLIIFALMLQLTDMSSDYILISKQFNLLGAIIGIAIITTMICGVILNGCFPSILLFPMLMKQYYPPVYFIYQSTFIFLLAFNYTQQYVLYILAGMAFVFLLYNAVYRPYPQKFHTFVLIFHQIVIIGVIGIYIFENQTKPTENQALYKIINGVIIGLLYIIVMLNGYRIYQYYKFLQLNGWNQYGNPEGFQYDGGDNLYKNLKTAKGISQTPRKIEQNYGTNHPQKNNKIKQIQLQQVKKTNKDANSGSKVKPLRDQKPMNWKYNKLAQDDINRLDATNRDVKPDTSRDQPLNRTKTNQKNLRNSPNNDTNKNLDETYTLKDDQGKNRKNGNRNKNNETFDQDQNGEGNDGDYNNNSNNRDENIFDNPYDENGYSKNKGKRSIQDQQDPLDAIKRRYRKDFNNKVKVSTIKEA